MKAQNEDRATYMLTPMGELCTDDEVIAAARNILYRRLHRKLIEVGSPQVVRDYLGVKLAQLEHEVFGVLWLDTQNKMLADDEMFRGSLCETSVYPREMVKMGLARNAGACILYHNHPSGRADPSPADERLTKVLKDALALVDIKVLDHFIVARLEKPTSFAELGLI